MNRKVILNEEGKDIFKAINDGKQACYLCPTTILSSQQYNSALERFADFPINIALLNRFTSQKDQTIILQKLILLLKIPIWRIFITI